MGANIIGCMSSCMLLYNSKRATVFFLIHTDTHAPHIIVANNKLQINCCCYTFFIAQLQNCVCVPENQQSLNKKRHI